MRIAIYPGSFDPITLGHMDIIQRCAVLYDRLFVAIGHNINKKGLFSYDERMELILEGVQHLPNIVVDIFGGLLVDYMDRHSIKVIIRGIRTFADYENELQLAFWNHHMNPQVETLFMVANPKYAFVSSTAVKTMATLCGSIEDLVSPHVEEALNAKNG